MLNRIAATVLTVSDYTEYLRVLEVISNPRFWGADVYRRDLLPSGLPWKNTEESEIETEMRASGYHRCPDGMWRQTPSNGMFDGLCGACEMAMSEYDHDETEAVLPEITFDRQGWSQQLKAADGSWFYIFRRSDCKYSLTSATGYRETVQMSFAGALAAAHSRVYPAPKPEALNPETTTEDDRRTNYGAF